MFPSFIIDDESDTMDSEHDNVVHFHPKWLVGRERDDRVVELSWVHGMPHDEGGWEDADDASGNWTNVMRLVWGGFANISPPQHLPL